MPQWFVPAPLFDAGVAAAVLGRVPDGAPASVADHALAHTAAGSVLRPEPGTQTAGFLLTLTGDDPARLTFFATAQGLDLAHIPYAGQPVLTLLAARHGPAGPPDLARAIAIDTMAAQGQIAATDLRKRRAMVQVQTASRLRAQAETQPKPDRGVTIAARYSPYANFFAVAEYDLSYQRFDGSFGQPVNRAAFISGDAVIVLPYDPVRDRVLLIEQFRVGPMARGDLHPWQYEAVAGRIDAGETPEDAARREAVEEAGLTLGALHFIGGYYPTPGANSEYLYSYIATTDLPDGAAGVFGLAEEAEDIRGHLLPLSTAMHMMATGQITNAPLLISLLWLGQNRATLRPSP